MPISNSVGRGGANSGSDVKYLQAILNFWRRDHGRPEIKVDGIVGPITIGAIEDYQRSRGGVVDGRADADGPTIKSLDGEFEEYQQTVKAYCVLGLVLSYDPEFGGPMLNERVVVNMFRESERGAV